MFALPNILMHAIVKRHSYWNVPIDKCMQLHTSMPHNVGVLEMVKSYIPPLTNESHKGQDGRIAVIGGSQEYTGAPYFAAMTALRVGCDLSHVFCAENAATAIKAYSPDLIVHPALDRKNAVQDINTWLPRFHSVIIGPGLGRDQIVINNIKEIMKEIKSLGIPVVIDADGLFIITEDPDIINGYKNAILTPNIVEFTRLFEKVIGRKPDLNEPIKSTIDLSRALGNVTLVRKGVNDVITDGEHVLVCCAEGSPRRCGGQGDILSGALGTFLYWAYQAEEKGTSSDLSFNTYGPNIAAAYGACSLVRECARLAFKKRRRSTVTTDMLDEINQGFELLYE